MYVPARADGAAHVTLVDVAGPIATCRLDLPPASQVILGRGPAIAASHEGDTIRIAIADPAVSRDHVRLMRVESGWVLEDLGSKNGTMRLGAALRSGRLLDGDVFEIGATFIIFRHGGARSVGAVRLVSAAELAALPPALASFHPHAEEEATRLAAITRARIPLLLVGECGTDKALVAHALHDRWGGGGAIGPIDCAAQTPRTLEGALASAAARLETVVLRDVSALTRPGQQALRAALAELAAPLRIVATARPAIEAARRDGVFDDALYERVAGYVHRIRPLAARREDILWLVHELGASVGVASLSLTHAAARALLHHDWPSNLSELRETVLQGLCRGGSHTLDLRDLPLPIRHSSLRSSGG